MFFSFLSHTIFLIALYYFHEGITKLSSRFQKIITGKNFKTMHLITSHLNTDLDSLASMVAAQKLYPDAVICPPGSMNRKVRNFMAHHSDKWNIYKPKKLPLDEVTKMIVVDTRSRQRVGTFAALTGRNDVEVHVYDHHPPTIDDIPAQKFVYEPLGAAVTIMIELILKERISITPDEATLFALGIYSDTGALTYESTTERDIKALGNLIKLGADLSHTISQVEVEMSAADLKLLDTLSENIREIYINGAKVALTWAQTSEYVEGLSQFVHRLRDFCESHVTIAIVNNGGKKINIIARSAPDVLNVKEFLAPYGGSGHYQAGSATLSENRDPLELLDEIEKKLHDSIPVMLKVTDIMTSPVIAVSPDSKVSDGYRTALRFGLSSLPVANADAEVLGMISRKDIDRAHLHGLDKALISDFMTQGVISLNSGASIDEAHRMMAIYGYERMPVLENGKLIGMMTRSDLVKALYRSGQFATYGSSYDSDFYLWIENIANLMEESFTENQLSLLKRIGKKAQSMGMRAYLVGGTVRDLLMGVKNVDIDISVEGDAEKLVMSWDEPGCKSRLHGRYKTGTIIFPDGEKVDIATARREFYEYAASQPIVENSSLKQDLGRRDFTVNAMSVSLSDDDWGTLTDNFGGRADLRDGLLKILHNLSFVEDPSRILRGIKLEQRLNMKFEENTMRLLQGAVKGGLVECLSTTRIRAELELISKEANFKKMFMRMRDLNIWESLFPGIQFGERDDMERRLHLLEHFLHQVNKHEVDFKGMAWLIGVAVVLADSRPDIQFAAMDRMSLNPIERKELTICFTEWQHVEKICSQKKSAHSNSEIYNVLQKYQPLQLVYWLTCFKTPEARRVIIEHMEGWTRLKGELTGGDIKYMGLRGKEISEALHGIKLARIDGLIKTREEEESFIKSLLMRRAMRQ